MRFIFLLVSFGLMFPLWSCSSDSNTENTSSFSLSGDWNVQESFADADCTQQLDDRNYSLTLVQDGNALSLVIGNEEFFGNLDQDTVNWDRQYYDTVRQAWMVLFSINAVVIGDRFMKGSIQWEIYSGDAASGPNLSDKLCSAASIFAAQKGPNSDAADFGNPPPAPTDFQGYVLDDSSFGLVWNDISNSETAYRIDRSVNGGAYSPLITLGEDVQAYIDANLAPSTLYAYKVVAINDAGDSLDSTIVEHTTSDFATAPVAPSNIAMTYQYAQQRLRVSWVDNADNEDSYEIIRTSSLHPTKTFTLAANTKVFYDTDELDNKDQYTYKIIAKNNIGENSASKNYTPNFKYINIAILNPGTVTVTNESATGSWKCSNTSTSKLCTFYLPNNSITYLTPSNLSVTWGGACSKINKLTMVCSFQLTNNVIASAIFPAVKM